MLRGRKGGGERGRVRVGGDALKSSFLEGEEGRKREGGRGRLGVGTRSSVGPDATQCMSIAVY